VPTRLCVSLDELLSTPVLFAPQDAVALIVQLARAPLTGRPLSVRLEPAHVWLHQDGSVSLTPGVYPTVSEAAELVEHLLAAIRDTGQHEIPRALSFIVVRARGQHDGTALPSLTAFATALAPFQPADAAAAIRALTGGAPVTTDAACTMAIAPSPGPAPAPPPIPTAAPATPVAVAAPPTMAAPPPRPPSRSLALAAVAAMVLAALLGMRLAQMTSTGASVPALAADVPTAPAPPAVEPPPAIDRTATPPATTPAPTPTPTPTPTPRRPPPEPLVQARDASADAIFSPSFSANGSAVFFHARAEEGSALKRAEPGDAGELRVATIVDDGASNYHVRLSPDGASVAFDSNRDGVRGVYLARADGQGVRRVSGPGYAAVPTWAPDGRRLAVVRAEADRPAVWNLWLLDLESGLQSRVTSFRYGQVWGGAWFADGRRIAYSHEHELVIHDLATGREQSYDSPLPRRLVRTPAVSPDGRWIMFQVRRDGAWLLDVQRGAMTRILEDPTAEEFTWAPDGRRVAFHSRRSGGWSLWTMAAP
jgi:hypothetical protein